MPLNPRTRFTQKRLSTVDLKASSRIQIFVVIQAADCEGGAVVPACGQCWPHLWSQAVGGDRRNRSADSSVGELLLRGDWGQP